MHQLADLKMIFSFGNNVEGLVELHVVALSIVTDDTSNFVFIGLNVQLFEARASRSAECVDDLGYLVQRRGYAQTGKVLKNKKEGLHPD